MIADLAEALAGRWTAIDIEGDGHAASSPVEIALVEHEGSAAIRRSRWTVNPGRAIDPFVSGLHGLSDADVADAPAFAEIEDEVREAIAGRLLVGHAPSHDLRMLETVMPGAWGVPSAVIDTQRLARNVMPGLPRYGLDVVAGELGVAVPAGEGRGGFHTALHDAETAAACFVRLVGMAPRTTPRIARHYARCAFVEPPRVREPRPAGPRP